MEKLFYTQKFFSASKLEKMLLSKNNIKTLSALLLGFIALNIFIAYDTYESYKLIPRVSNQFFVNTLIGVVLNYIFLNVSVSFIFILMSYLKKYKVKSLTENSLLSAMSLSFIINFSIALFTTVMYRIGHKSLFSPDCNFFHYFFGIVTVINIIFYIFGFVWERQK